MFHPFIFSKVSRNFNKTAFASILAVLALLSGVRAGGEWHMLFDGSSLENWRSNKETPGVFTIMDDGALKVSGGRAHLFWAGSESIPAEFKDFELTLQLKTTEGSNSGIFFHTKYQDKGWPEWGLEAQVNSSHKDKRKTGSLYAVKDVVENSPTTDGQWHEYTIRVEGNTVTVSVDGEIVNVYVEPEDVETPKGKPHVHLGKGTFAIQGHDPKSTIYYRDIKVRVPDAKNAASGTTGG